jgi:PAS domain S-box-containing protein
MERAFDRVLSASLGLVVALLLISAGLGYWNTRRLNEDAGWTAHTHDVIEALLNLVSTVKDAETGQRGFIITGQPGYLDPYNTAVATLQEELDKVKRLTADNPRQQAHIPVLQSLVAAKLKELQRTIGLRQRDVEAARRLVLSGAGKQAMDAIRAQVEAMMQEERELLREREQRTRSSYRVAVTTGLLSAILGLGMVGAFVYLLRRHLLSRAKAAAELYEQREWFRTTLASIGDAVIVTDAEGRVTFLNPVAQDLTGWRQEEARGFPLENVFVIINEASRQAVENPALRAMREGRIVGLANHTLLIARDGKEKPLDDSAAPIRDDRGTIVGSVLVFRDIESRRIIEQQRDELIRRLEREQARLAEADRRKNEFLATLAHELRNPLAPIRNAVHVMQLADGNGEVMTRVRDTLERQVHQLVRLVDDLMDVSRITMGKVALHQQRLELASVIQSALETSRPLIEATRHELTVTLAPHPLYVVGDLTRLAQVVTNLLNNATKYTPEGGHIWLSVERQANNAVIRVRDNGAGIPADMLSHIFEMFTQADRSAENAQVGLGIGLTLVRSLVEMHGGSIEATSEGPGLGSEFTVRLPLAPDRPDDRHSAAGSDTAQQSQQAPSWRILVVDDNVDSAGTLGLLLRMMGHTVRLVHDGPSAVEAAAGFVPDVVLLDIGLPGMSGYEVARQIRKLPALQHVVLVAQTGWGQQEDRRRSEAAGFQYHLVKPLDPDALQDLLVALAAAKP